MVQLQLAEYSRQLASESNDSPFLEHYPQGEVATEEEGELMTTKEDSCPHA